LRIGFGENDKHLLESIIPPVKKGIGKRYVVTYRGNRFVCQEKNRRALKNFSRLSA
jgi:hypothetical protein